MSALDSDALVFFGATGDLAYKKILPSLQALVKRRNLKEYCFYVYVDNTPTHSYMKVVYEYPQAEYRREVTR